MRISTFLLSLLLLASPATAVPVNEDQKLLASDASAGDKFGLSVAASADVLVVGADISDVGKGEGDDLAGVGRVREDFLIAGD